METCIPNPLRDAHEGCMSLGLSSTILLLQNPIYLATVSRKIFVICILYLLGT